MAPWEKGEGKQEEGEAPTPADDDVSYSDLSSRIDGSGPGGGRFDLGRSGSKSAYDVDKEVILALEFASDSWNRVGALEFSFTPSMKVPDTHAWVLAPSGLRPSPRRPGPLGRRGAWAPPAHGRLCSAWRGSIPLSRPFT